MKQHTIIDVLGGWSREVDLSMRELWNCLGTEEEKSQMNAESYHLELILESDQCLLSLA